jgi:hypothetical protein
LPGKCFVHVQPFVQEIDPFSECPELDVLTKGDQSFEFVHFTHAELPEHVLQWAVELTHKSLGHLYNQTWGWDAEKKYSELAHVR